MKYIKCKYLPIDVKSLQKLISLTKDTFAKKLSENLALIKVEAPLFLSKESGLSDDLTGVERKVQFDLLDDSSFTFEALQSLAKWKRYALGKYDFEAGEGLYTNMSAIRRDEIMDELHSIYVDQWDWEKVITDKNRTEEYLKSVVTKIVKAIVETSKRVAAECSLSLPKLCEDIHFITSQELLDLYPTLSPKEREYAITKKYGTVFISKIGKILSDGSVHDLRSPDYDDWDLNGDILMYHEALDCALEISSMGIRVDKTSLIAQLKASNATERMQYSYHQMLINDELPLTIGGGIGQSRLCMLILGRVHVGEVQVSHWKENILKQCAENGIKLL